MVPTCDECGQETKKIIVDFEEGDLVLRGCLKSPGATTQPCIIRPRRGQREIAWDEIPGIWVSTDSQAP